MGLLLECWATLQGGRRGRGFLLRPLWHGVCGCVHFMERPMVHWLGGGACGPRAVLATVGLVGSVVPCGRHHAVRVEWRHTIVSFVLIMTIATVQLVPRSCVLQFVKLLKSMPYSRHVGQFTEQGRGRQGEGVPPPPPPG